MQGIGQLLWKLREKEGIRQKQLCLGISSVSKYARMEADQQEIDFFLIDRIMGRLGKSVERLTYILPRDIYNIYELRQEIQQKICQKKREEAKQCLLEYEKNKRARTRMRRAVFKNAPLVSITQGERLFSISSLVLIIEFCLSSLPAASRG